MMTLEIQNDNLTLLCLNNVKIKPSRVVSCYSIGPNVIHWHIWRNVIDSPFHNIQIIAVTVNKLCNSFILIYGMLEF